MAPKLQLISILAVAVVDLELTSSCAPYIDDSDDFHADIAQWCTVTLLLFSIALEVEAIGPESSGLGLAFVLLLFAVLGTFIGYAIFYAWTDLKDILNLLLNPRKSISVEAGELEIAQYPTDKPEQGPRDEVTDNDFCFPMTASTEYLGFRVNKDTEEADDEPEYIPYETNTTDASATKMGIIEAYNQMKTRLAHRQRSISL